METSSPIVNPTACPVFNRVPTTSVVSRSTESGGIQSFLFPASWA
jgi:hypothetical protein